MDINLKVTFDKRPSPWQVDVDEKNNDNQIKRDKDAQVIRWKIQGNAKGASFLPIEGDCPGFEWLPPVPPPGVFKDAKISSSTDGVDDVLKIKDFNTDDKSKGEWYYLLRIKLGSEVYESPPTRVPCPTAATKSPVIVNN